MNNFAGKLIAAFVMLIIGSSLIGVIATQGNDIQDLESASDTFIVQKADAEGSISTTARYNLTTGWNDFRGSDYASECLPTTLTVVNATGTALTVTTDYAYTKATGSVAFVNSSTMVDAFKGGTNATTISYKRCPTDYLGTSWGRSAIDVTMGLFGIALLLGAVGLAMSAFKDSGIIGRD